MRLAAHGADGANGGRANRRRETAIGAAAGKLACHLQAAIRCGALIKGEDTLTGWRCVQGQNYDKFRIC